MARAEYNHTFDLFHGPAGFPPNALRAQVPGRFVRRDWIRIQSRPLNFWIGWITTDSVLAATGGVNQAGTNLTIVTAGGDRVACPAIGLALTPILWIETVAPPGQLPYVRWHIGKWPFGPE